MVKLREMRDIKVVIVGDGTVGKTCLLVKYVEHEFSVKYKPTIFDNKVKKVTYHDHQLGMNLWDTAGQEDYDTLRPLSYNDADVFIMCFSVVNDNSFKNVQFKWVDEVREYAADANLLLCGTKCDLREDAEYLKVMKEKDLKQISNEAAQALQKQLKCYAYVETSSKTGEGVEELFELVLDSCFAALVSGGKGGGGRRGRLLHHSIRSECIISAMCGVVYTCGKRLKSFNRLCRK